MNLFNLDEQTRIKILKYLVLQGAAGTLINLYFLKKTTERLSEVVRKHNANARRMKVAGKIINRLIKDADPALLEEIVRDYQFDWVVSDIDPDDLKP